MTLTDDDGNMDAATAAVDDGIGNCAVEEVIDAGAAGTAVATTDEEEGGVGGDELRDSSSEAAWPETPTVWPSCKKGEIKDGQVTVDLRDNSGGKVLLHSYDGGRRRSSVVRKSRGCC